MKKLALIAAVLLYGCGGNPLPTYGELKQYPLDCKKKNDQIQDLKDIQRLKYFGPDPEKFSDEDRAYYALLKEHIWWFSYNCEQ